VQENKYSFKPFVPRPFVITVIMAHDSASDAGHSPSVVPIIDFSKFRSSNPDEALATSQKLFAAFRDSGFAYLQDHGLSQEVVDEAFAWVSLPHYGAACSLPG
jgi:hypothetical protein